MTRIIKSVEANKIAQLLTDNYNITKDESIFLGNLIDTFMISTSDLMLKEILSADEEFLGSLEVTICDGEQNEISRSFRR